jgi:hypothetical protein
MAFALVPLAVKFVDPYAFANAETLNPAPRVRIDEFKFELIVEAVIVVSFPAAPLSCHAIICPHPSPGANIITKNTKEPKTAFTIVAGVFIKLRYKIVVGF